MSDPDPATVAETYLVCDGGVGKPVVVTDGEKIGRVWGGRSANSALGLEDRSFDATIARPRDGRTRWTNARAVRRGPPRCPCSSTAVLLERPGVDNVGSLRVADAPFYANGLRHGVFEHPETERRSSRFRVGTVHRDSRRLVDAGGVSGAGVHEALRPGRRHRGGDALRDTSKRAARRSRRDGDVAERRAVQGVRRAVRDGDQASPGLCQRARLAGTGERSQNSSCVTRRRTPSTWTCWRGKRETRQSRSIPSRLRTASPGGTCATRRRRCSCSSPAR